MIETQLNASVSEREEIAEGLWIVKVVSDEGPLPEFVAGQYAELGFTREFLEQAGIDPGKGKAAIVRRAYSIASAPGETESLEFLIVKVDDGVLTPQLYQLPVGGKLWLGPKIKGKFTLENIPRGKNLVMVATGTGLAPYISMLREYRSDPLWDRYVVIHGTRVSEDLAYRDELENIASKDERVVYIPTVTREPEGSSWSGLRGRVGVALEQDAFRELVGTALDPATCHVFLCGNPAMIDSVRESLEGVGFNKHSRRNPGNIHFERYW